MSSSLCPSCFSRQYEAGRCGKCGFAGAEYKPERTALPLGSVTGTYRIGLMKSNSRQSQVYTAAHTETSTPVIIEEFFPAKVAGRLPNTAEVVLAATDPELTQRFQQACLLIESSTQRRPLKRIETFRANNTVYSVFEPVSTVSVAAQCEMMADNPYYFRDQNGKPMMTINALPIPDMPAERMYDADRYRNERPNTQAADENDRHPQTVIEEATSRNRRQKYIRIGSIAAALVLLVTTAGVVIKNAGPREGDGPAEQTVMPEVVLTPEPKTADPAETAGSGIEAEPTEAGSEHDEKAPAEGEKGPIEQEKAAADEESGTAEEEKNAAEEEQDAAEGEESASEKESDTSGAEEDPAEKEEDADDPEFLSKSEFIKRLQVVVGETTDKYSGTKLKPSATSVDHTASGKPDDFQEAMQVIPFGGKIIQKSTKTNFKNKVYVVIEHDDINPGERRITSRYRVPLFQKDKSGEPYIMKEGAVLSFRTWVDLGEDVPKGTRVYFPIESADKLEKNLDTWLNWKDVEISLKEEERQIKLVFAENAKNETNPPETITVCVYEGVTNQLAETPENAEDTEPAETSEPQEEPGAAVINPSEPEEETALQTEEDPTAAPATDNPEEISDADSNDTNRTIIGIATSQPEPLPDAGMTENDLPDIECTEDENGMLLSVKCRTAGNVMRITIKANKAGEKDIELESSQSMPGYLVWSLPKNVKLAAGEYDIIFTYAGDKTHKKNYSLRGSAQS